MAAQGVDIQDLLNKKLKAYDDFLAATLLLRKALESNDMVMVVGSIKRRRDMISFIDGLDRKLGKRRRSLTVEQKSEMARAFPKITSEIRERLKTIGQIDMECITLAERGYDGLARQLTSYRREKEGLRGYASQNRRVPKFLNLHT